MQQRTEVTTRRKEKGNKRGRDITLRSRHQIETCEGRRPPTQSRPRNQSHNMKSSYKQKGVRNLKLLSQLRSQRKIKTTMSRHEIVVATSTLEKHLANKVATTNDAATIDPSSCKKTGCNRNNEVTTDHEQSREIHVATST